MSDNSTILELVKTATGIRRTNDYDSILNAIISSEIRIVEQIGIMSDGSDEYLWLIAQRATFRWEHRHDKDADLSPMIKSQTNDLLFYQKGHGLS